MVDKIVISNFSIRAGVSRIIGPVLESQALKVADTDCNCVWI